MLPSQSVLITYTVQKNKKTCHRIFTGEVYDPGCNLRIMYTPLEGDMEMTDAGQMIFECVCSLNTLKTYMCIHFKNTQLHHPPLA